MNAKHKNMHIHLIYCCGDAEGWQHYEEVMDNNY